MRPKLTMTSQPVPPGGMGRASTRYRPKTSKAATSDAGAPGAERLERELAGQKLLDSDRG